MTLFDKILIYVSSMVCLGYTIIQYVDPGSFYNTPGSLKYGKTIVIPMEGLILAIGTYLFVDAVRMITVPSGFAGLLFLIYKQFPPKNPKQKFPLNFKKPNPHFAPPHCPNTWTAEPQK